MADNSFNANVGSLFQGMEGFITGKTVVGDAVKFDDGTIILPLVDVSFGVAAGAFAEPGTEGVPQVVNTKMREQIWFTVFQFSLIHFLHVVSYADSLNRPIDIVGAHE